MDSVIFPEFSPKSCKLELFLHYTPIPIPCRKLQEKKAMKETKTITLIIVGTGNPKAEDVNIVKGSTTEDIKRSSPNLKKKMEYTFVRKATGEALNKGVDLFEILEDHEKVDASPSAELGGMREAISRFFLFFSEKQESVIPVVYPSYEPLSYKRPVIVAKPIELLGTDAQMEELEWVMHGNGFEGQIYGLGNNYVGNLIKSWSGYKLYIFNPPACVFYGKHKNCFMPQGAGWYFVHFVSGDANPISMIRETERYIVESGGAV